MISRNNNRHGDHCGRGKPTERCSLKTSDMPFQMPYGKALYRSSSEYTVAWLNLVSIARAQRVNGILSPRLNAAKHVITAAAMMVAQQQGH